MYFFFPFALEHHQLLLLPPSVPLLRCRIFLFLHHRILFLISHIIHIISCIRLNQLVEPCSCTTKQNIGAQRRNVPYIYAVVSIKYALQYSGQMKIEKKTATKSTATCGNARTNNNNNEC